MKSFFQRASSVVFIFADVVDMSKCTMAVCRCCLGVGLAVFNGGMGIHEWHSLGSLHGDIFIERRC